MKYRIVFRLLGCLLFLESVAMCGCGLIGELVTTGEKEGGGSALYVSALITFLVGFLFTYALGKKSDELPKREGLVLVGLTWIVFGGFGAIPYIISEPQLHWVDALFESISGFTTTGSTVIEDLSLWSNDILLWRATTQWLGGLGILVLFMALLSSLGSGSKFLFKNESSFQMSEISAVKIHDVAVLLLKFYLLMTLTCSCGLRAMGMTWFEATTHAFTAVSTAGFSIYNESIAYFSDWKSAWMIELWLALFMMLASLSFVFYLILWRGEFQKARKKEEVVIYLIMLGVGVSFMMLAEYQLSSQASLVEIARHSFFMVVSFSTTTGYGLLPEREWPIYLVLLLMIMTLIGGCSGSTAGGMKVSRIVVLWRTVKEALVKVFRPHKYSAVRINGRNIESSDGQMIVLFVALNFCILLASIFFVALLEAGQKIDLMTALGAVVGTLTNVGPGWGEVGLWGNFAKLEAGTKLFLTFLMILGRLELFTLLALLVPSTWKRFQ